MLGLAIASQTTALVVNAGICVAYAGLARSAAPPRFDLEASSSLIGLIRTIEAEAPEPGDEIGVTVTVANISDRLLTDVRIADGVPAELDVVDGTTRHTDVLTPGSRSSFFYTEEDLGG